MINIQIGLGYAIVHLLSVIYMFKMFDYQGYDADEWDRWIVWLFAPELIIITFIRALGGK